ncbi:FAD-binding oxidoreductase [Pseudoroseicyclus sp. CXY001]|uniref:FAD-binding oxidoreductase n=1 Tax=Pseudoroseicyclus sp. CXY001 TaxID=3242492 RepID=UPI003571627B
MAYSDALEDLSQLLGPRLTRGEAERAAHGQSESWFAPAPPDAVAWPESTGEVAAILKICSRHGLPVIPFGAGTSLEGQTLAPMGGLALDMSRMAKVVALAPEDMDVRVQPGITRGALDAELRTSGLFFPVDPGADASLGGMASTRASGTTTLRYGGMRENVLGLEVVLASGEVIRTGGRARKSAAGYDLTALFLGAEGTLGVITELTLRLHGRPEHVATATCAFPDVAAAVATVTETGQAGLRLARMELMDAAVARAVNAADDAGFPEAPHLLVEFHGSEQAVAAEVALFEAIAEGHGASGFAWASREEDRRALWRMRHRAYWSILAGRPGARAIVTDICVPVSRLAEAIAETQADIAASGLAGPILGHVGDGNFHAILMVDGSVGEIATAKRLATAMGRRALAMGGTVTGEHGIGLGKAGLLEEQYGPAVATMAALKAALDPQGILNPGKIFRAPPAGQEGAA